ncbi:DUF3013 family protein [Enterococcus ratti]|nr:DUF3013 family protein [Enterococcus ratti]
MGKTNLLDYLDKKIEATITDYDVTLDWDTKNHTIEISVCLFAENKAHMEVDDVQGVVSEEEIIEFEDGVLLFDPKKSIFDEKNYLAVVPYEGKKGLPKSMIDALIEYLNEVLARGQNDLFDFLDEKNQKTMFELKWEEQCFTKLVEEKQKNGFDTYFSYPSY